MIERESKEEKNYDSKQCNLTIVYMPILELYGMRLDSWIYANLYPSTRLICLHYPPKSLVAPRHSLSVAPFSSFCEFSATIFVVVEK